MFIASVAELDNKKWKFGKRNVSHVYVINDVHLTFFTNCVFALSGGTETKSNCCHQTLRTSDVAKLRSYCFEPLSYDILWRHFRAENNKQLQKQNIKTVNNKFIYLNKIVLMDKTDFSGKL